MSAFAWLTLRALSFLFSHSKCHGPATSLQSQIASMPAVGGLLAGRACGCRLQIATVDS
jgi:hypothetical protein